MRIIQLRLDNKLFNMMEKDKNEKDFKSWEAYILDLFGFNKEKKK